MGILRKISSDNKLISAPVSTNMSTITLEIDARATGLLDFLFIKNVNTEQIASHAADSADWQRVDGAGPPLLIRFPSRSFLHVGCSWALIHVPRSQLVVEQCQCTWS